MNPLKYSITFACYNQVDYTMQCVNSMIKHGLDLSRLVVVDNGSGDSTRDYLKSLPLGGRIFNQANLGCGVAWNQGALALQSEWTIVMNNDVLVSRGWIEHLIEAAEQNGLKIISPSLIEGPLDYDFDAFADQASVKMKDALRIGDRHAVCLAVHQSVWMEIGYFQPIPKLLGYEDTMFFHEADKAGIPTGMTGRSWLHHYGSITQTAMKQERGLSERDSLSNRHNYRLLQQSWLERKLKKIKKIRQKKSWYEQELAQFGMSMHGIRKNGAFSWQ
ncbi:glycosyltransferase [Methylomicrobium sp. Wu6]|uniref:glycosyltransferase family 2 protein n=1 Tax=Methylomicrobium sp. Wu6 TaxID=3107928 RepID=UPI002DD638F9|nr:glycosyltransferase [Methylomicrobium sp. Wu6]MEC4748761.1 glycosyltransferase [Methylomicrobium sp. Wu6]